MAALQYPPLPKVPMQANRFLILYLTDLWWGAGELNIEDVILYEWCPLSFFDELIQGVEDWTVWCDVVEDTSHWVSVTLDHYMLDA